MNDPQNPPLPSTVARSAPAQDLATAPHPMEQWISHVLRGGVLIAGTIIAAGLLLLLVQGAGPDQPASMRALRAQAGHTVAVHPLGILAAAAHLQASGIIELGLLALILTPITRVAMTAVLFLVQRDRIFTVVTCIVLAILLLGLVGVGS